MGQLRDRMEEDLKLRNVSPSTRKIYLLYARKFVAHWRRPPTELGAPEVRRWLLHLMQVELVSYETYRQCLAAVKFLYKVTLGRACEVARFLARDVPRGREYLLMADADMVPLPEPRGRDGHPVLTSDSKSHSEGILYEPGHAVYCAYACGDGHPGHPGDDDALGEGFCRLSAEALMATGPGWFCQDRGPHVNEVRGCEGTALSKRLWSAAYDIRCVGIVGHRKMVDLFPRAPSAAPGALPRFRWPAASDHFIGECLASATAHSSPK